MNTFFYSKALPESQIFLLRVMIINKQDVDITQKIFNLGTRFASFLYKISAFFELK